MTFLNVIAVVSALIGVGVIVALAAANLIINHYDKEPRP